MERKVFLQKKGKNINTNTKIKVLFQSVYNHITNNNVRGKKPLNGLLQTVKKNENYLPFLTT